MNQKYYKYVYIHKQFTHNKTLYIALLITLFSLNTACGNTNIMEKNFKLKSSQIERLVPDIGFAYVTDMITVEGKKVDYMVRQKPNRDDDSGWIFYGGGETQKYIDDASNTSLLSVNTIANYDPEIITFLTYPPGTEIERDSQGKLHVITPDIQKPDVIFFHPVDDGIIQVTKGWSFNVSARMLRRFEKGSLVVWRPGFTILIESYSPSELKIDERLIKITNTISPDNEGFEQKREDGIQKLRYRLQEETDGKKQSSAYIFGLTTNQEIHMSIYYDDPSDLVEIEKIWSTLQYKDT